MADSKSSTSRSAGEKPEVADAADAAQNKTYAENPDKPDPSTVAQVEVLPGEDPPKA